MVTKAEQLEQLKHLYEDGVLNKEAYETGMEKLGYPKPNALPETKISISSSSIGVVGDKNIFNAPVIVHPPDSSKPDAAEILRAYKNQLVKSVQHLSLRAIDIKSSDPSENQKPLSLDRVYVGLDTTTQIEKEKSGKESDRKADSIRDRDTRPLSALEAGAKNRSLVILGDPGSGKSTFVNHLILCLCRNGALQNSCEGECEVSWPEAFSGLIPILVIVRDFAQSISEKSGKADVTHLWEFIRSRLTSQNLSPAAALLENALETGTAIVLLDGLDEIGSTQKRTFIRDAITAFSTRYDKSRFIVTCRVLSYQKPAWRLEETAFPSFKLAPFDEAKIDRFITAWYQDLMPLDVIKSPQERDTSIQRLKTAVQKKALQPLAPNPLLLTVMALVHTHKGRLPDARALLYKECVEILLWRWDQVRFTDQHALPRLQELLNEADRKDVDVKRVLYAIAFETHKKSVSAKEETLADIPEWDLIKAFSSLHPQGSTDWATQMVDTIKMRAGLLIEREPTIYAFPHRTFQEYLAGVYLSIQADFAKHVSSLIENGNFWREAMLLAVGHLIYVNGNVAMPLFLAGELCPPETADTDPDWRKVWMAGDVLVEIGVNRVKDSRQGEALLNRVRARLTELLEKGKLEPKERVAAGNALSTLGDPRFDSEKWYLPKGEDMGFISIPAGAFMMGSDKEKDSKARENETPRHRVQLSAYKIGRYPVTVGAFQAFVQESGYQPEGKWEKYNEFLNHPVVLVTWNDAIRYCEWLTEKLRDRGFQVRLPTEAQWEYAARGADGRIYPYGNEWVETKANSVMLIGETSPVGAFLEDVSFYRCMDMTGNVCEWCQDWYDETYYAKSPSVDPTGPKEGEGRVCRGGFWYFYFTAEWYRASYRRDFPPGRQTSLLGFRLVLLPGQH